MNSIDRTIKPGDKCYVMVKGVRVSCVPVEYHEAGDRFWCDVWELEEEIPTWGWNGTSPLTMVKTVRAELLRKES